MVAAVSLESIGLREIKSESYEARKQRQRVRLTADEARPVRYVLSEWDGEVGGGSMWQAIMDRDQRVSVPHLVTDLFEVERWCTKQHAERQGILRSWRALREMADETPRSVVVLYALYGHVQPDVLNESDTPWDRAMAPEYARVAKYTAAAGGSSTSLQESLRLAVPKLDGESTESKQSRVLAARLARRALLAAVGAQCERLIADATLDYRNAVAQI